jgi:hypothetical protein
VSNGSYNKTSARSTEDSAFGSRDITRRQQTGVRGCGWTLSTEEAKTYNKDSASSNSSIIGSARGCLAPAAVWRDCPALYRNCVARCATLCFSYSSSGRTLIIHKSTSLTAIQSSRHQYVLGHRRAFTKTKTTPLAVQVPDQLLSREVTTSSFHPPALLNVNHRRSSGTSWEPPSVYHSPEDISGNLH